MKSAGFISGVCIPAGRSEGTSFNGAGSDKSINAGGLALLDGGPPNLMAGARAIKPRPTPGRGAGPLVAVPGIGPATG